MENEMRVFIASEFRCHICNGEYYLTSKAYSIYKHYSDAFGEVVLCSRFIEITNLESSMVKVNFIRDIIQIKSLNSALIGLYDKDIENKIRNCDLVIGRLPSIIAIRSCKIAEKVNKSYLVELMCDSWASYWNHGVSGKVIAPYMYLSTKSITYNANYAIYVTEKYLQKHYPCKNQSINASNVTINEISNDILINRLKKIKNKDNCKELAIMTSADIDLSSKGQRFVVRSMGKLKAIGITVTYYLAGNGNQQHLLHEAVKAKVENQIVFLGWLTQEEIFSQIDKVDIYIQPSLQEGLPRAVIEAMSRGCPCIGTNIAGTPELLDKDCIVETASSNDIVRVIVNMLSKGLEKYAIHNFERSKDYLESTLNGRRNQYFKIIIDELKEIKYGTNDDSSIHN